MKKKSILIAGVLALGLGVSGGPENVVQGQAEGQGYASFYLVYHSDTRGYYRPCG